MARNIIGRSAFKLAVQEESSLYSKWVDFPEGELSS